MCDTFVALGSLTLTGNTILAKNSDREPEEAQALVHIPRTKHSAAFVQCTFIDIPQVSETYEVILSKPFQMWGAEMGANEFGLTIGNEAVFTTVKMSRTNQGLTGMDMIRLCLERCTKATEALTLIQELLQTYGQDACGGYKNNSFFYHNSFIISDPEESFVFETAGKSWAYRRITDHHSISNGLGIHTDYDAFHLEIEPKAFPYFWRKAANPFSFKDYFSDILYTQVGRAKQRQSCSIGLLKNHIHPGVSVESAMDILKTHHMPDSDFTPKKATTACLCMHATGLTNPSTTTGSMVTELRKNGTHTLWMTGTSMPCLSVYIPFFFGTPTLENFRVPTAKPDDSFWWQAEKLHQWICQDYSVRKVDWQKETDRLQKSLIKQEQALFSGQTSMERLSEFSGKALTEVEELYQKFLSLI
ncbi:carcinine hydrolase/isopenicillin-N N-acyltransferase family protein [Mongoliitalea daihaiensis]|uniref:carcinine hydrolase/isopenicillin-N N-acyltransferase family protein n=1 Tax=Mongoliitalea daihaiensis TaxID=2782006 RepID=UPI001F383744|nr:carcinine hydrolase/isopenicillin-N N-acyltransferase family protein [Mongoliitalea daihaiensis]UJP64427.1 C69 family dipeptidase [Mongoliitalea daihaiensis]